jgi:hypothetical protein
MAEGGCPMHMVMERQGIPPSSRIGFPVREERRPNVGRVLNGSDKIAQTIAFVLHEEEVN